MFFLRRSTVVKTNKDCCVQGLVMLRLRDICLRFPIKGVGFSRAKGLRFAMGFWLANKIRSLCLSGFQGTGFFKVSKRNVLTAGELPFHELNPTCVKGNDTWLWLAEENSNLSPKKCSEA